MKDNLTSLITLIVGTSAFGAIVGYYTKYLLDLVYNKRLDKYTNKRKLYEELIQSLNIFLDNRGNSFEKQDTFLANYSTSWLWASEDVILKVGDFIDYISINDNGLEQNQKYAKTIFSEIIILMRKDLGHSLKKLEAKNYRFFSFKRQ